jgi:hypothetical protein
MTEHNFFIFGAGVTKSVFDYAPLNDQLINTLLEFNPLSPLKELSQKYDTNNIEILLTRLDIDIQHNQSGSEIRTKINAEIAEYFERFRFNPNILDDNKWLQRFANNFRNNDVILNLNYDCFLEGLLDYFGIWKPKKGYGFIDNPLVDSSCDNPSNIQILKIHGSEHFTYKPYVDKPESGAVFFEFNKNIFPKSAAHSFFGSRSIPSSVQNSIDKPYIIAPSYVKVPVVDISYLMLDAIEAVKTSSKLIVIGCSLRPEDSFLQLLLTAFLRNARLKNRKYIIISPDATCLGNRIRRYWGVNVNECLVEIPIKLENSIDKLCELLKP